MANSELEMQCSARLLGTMREVIADIQAWLAIFGPEDTGAMIQSIMNSTRSVTAYVTPKVETVVSMLLKSAVKYSKPVNEWNPPIKWSKWSTMYHYWDTLIYELDKEMINNRLQEKMNAWHPHDTIRV